jgi:hypothetical protein
MLINLAIILSQFKRWLRKLLHTYNFFSRADEDLDDLSKYDEYLIETFPNNPDSDSDDLEDGLECLELGCFTKQLFLLDNYLLRAIARHSMHGKKITAPIGNTLQAMHIISAKNLPARKFSNYSPI